MQINRVILFCFFSSFCSIVFYLDVNYAAYAIQPEKNREHVITGVVIKSRHLNSQTELNIASRPGNRNQKLLVTNISFLQLPKPGINIELRGQKNGRGFKATSISTMNTEDGITQTVYPIGAYSENLTRNKRSITRTLRFRVGKHSGILQTVKLYAYVTAKRGQKVEVHNLPLSANHNGNQRSIADGTLNFPGWLGFDVTSALTDLQSAQSYTFQIKTSTGSISSRSSTSRAPALVITTLNSSITNPDRPPVPPSIPTPMPTMAPLPTTSTTSTTVEVTLTTNTTSSTIVTSTTTTTMVESKNLYVATNGNDLNDGTIENPLASIQAALSKAIGGDNIIVRDGTYNASIGITRGFDKWVTIRAEHPYRVKLTNIRSGAARTIMHIAIPGSAKIAIEGFIFSNKVVGYNCSTRGPYYLVHFENVQDVILRNNILTGNNAPDGCNELLKINRGGDSYYPKNIIIKGNLFYDHANAPGADMIDSVRPGELDIVENIFCGRNAPNAQSFITLKREIIAGPLGITPRSPRYILARNIFLNWDGRVDQAFIQLGEDLDAQHMITDALIENNLILTNSSRQMAAPFQIKGSKKIRIRANSIVGNFNNSTTYGFRMGTEGGNPEVREITIYNNIWSDPSGSLPPRFINAYGSVLTPTIIINNNLFWNGGNSLGQGGSIPPQLDLNRIESDPALNVDQDTIILPIYDEVTDSFLSGNASIREEFERLISTYGRVSSISAAINSADKMEMPNDDILGNPRDNQPDIGAFEY